MPIDPAEQREREQRRVDVETEKATQAHEKYLKTLNDEIDALNKLGPLTQKQQDTLAKLTKRVTESTDAHEKHKKVINEKIEDMERENSAGNKLITVYEKVSKNLLTLAKATNTLLTTHHSYNIEVQKIIDLSGKFTKSTQAGTDAFNKMRTELNLTRQAGVEFGKVFSQINRMGIDTSKFVEGTKQLQKAFGQKGGTAMMGVAAGTKVSAPVLEAAMGGDQVAMAKAVRSANLDQTHALTRMTGGGGGLAGRASRFEETAARAAKVKDDIQAGMAAALDLGLGPEMGALALPLAEINSNVSKLVTLSMGANSGFLKFLQGGGIGGFGKMAGAGGGGGGGMSALTGVPPAGGGGMMAGLPAMGRLLGGGAIAAVGLAAGTAALHLAAQAPEGNFGSTKSNLTYAGRAMQGAGVGGGIGMMMGGPAGAAAGALLGGAIGGVTAAYERNKEAIDKTSSEWLDWGNKMITGLVLGQEAVNNIDYENSLLALKTNAEGAAAALDGMANEMANLPEVLEYQIAQSRLPNALASMDPKPMEDYLNKASKAAAAAMLVSSSDLSKSMGKVDLGIKSFENKAAEAKVNAERATTPQEREKFEKIEARSLEGARLGRSEKAKLEAKVQQQMEMINLVPAAEKAMEGVGMRKGFRGMETQAATVGFERQFAGTGNVEEMGKLQNQINTAYQDNVKDLEKNNASAMQMYQETIDRAEREKATLAVEDSRRNVLDNMAETARRAMEQRKRTTALELQELALANQQTKIQTALNQAMAATETIAFKRSQRAAALAKAQESFVRERGASPEEVGAYAGEGAKEAQTQLSSFMDTFNDRMANLKAKMEGANDAERLALTQRMYDLDAKRVELAHENLKAQMHAATAEEKHRQELIGSNRRISEIQRDTAAKMGMSWRVQMQYQGEVIAASRADLESKSREIEKMGSAIKAAGGDPKQNAEYMKAAGDYAQKAGDLIGQVMGKQRSFMEQSIANSFGIGGGTKVNPLINSRLFGEQVQGFGGQRQAVGAGGGPRTMEEQQMQNIRNLGPPVFGGIGGAPPGAMQGVPPGAPGAAPGAPGVAQAGGKPGVDVSGNVQVAVSLDTPMLKAEVKSAVEVAMKEAARPGNMA